MGLVKNLILAAILAPSVLASMTYYALRLRGGSQIYANDPPVRKGRVILFHRYPDGSYMSLSADEVESVVPVAAPPAKAADRSSPYEAVFIGSAVEGPNHERSEPVRPFETVPSETLDFGSFGYSGYAFGGYFPRPVPRNPPPMAPSRIAPNGFPILAPPGSPGSAPPRIGPNGFPVIGP